MGAPSHPWAQPITGQTIGSVIVEGTETIVWPRGSVQRSQTVSFWLKAWQAIGGASANTSAATKYLLKQVEELASNRDSQPVYIQWTATADPAGLLNATELHDGWYVISDFEPDYSINVVTGLVKCLMTVTETAAAAPRSVSYAYQGAALSSNFSGAATNLLSLPVGSTALEANITRTAAEGSVPCILSPVASPEPTVLSATLANIFKGGCHVYDTINTGLNPVPTSGGTFVNANWVEVFWSDHDFTGDCVITNGLLLVIFVAGGAPGITCYVWNPALASANWQQFATLNYFDNAGNGSTLRSYKLGRIGSEECSLVATSNTSANQIASVFFRLQRGRYEIRTTVQPLTQAAAQANLLLLGLPATPKILYNSGAVSDVALSEASPGPQTDYGFGAAFIANSAQPFVAGFLYQNQSGSTQPNSNNNANVGLGDNASLAINAQRTFGIFALPYGVNASYSTANLQAEAESGTLGTGWTSQANASASGGNEAKCASGTLTGNADLWGTAFVPNPGIYDLWVRMKVTSAASSTSSLQVGLWNSTDSVFVGSTTYAPNALTTSYAWYRVAAGVTPTATKNMRVRAVTTATTPTDFFVDESALVPLALTADDRGPRDLWQQFAYDRSTRLVRP